MNWVIGSAEPDARGEPWPLRLDRLASGTLRLVLVTPGAVQPIFGIHQRLQAQLERLPTGTELQYLCRVADGAHYNVRNLIAVDLVSSQPGLVGVVDYLLDELVNDQPALIAARAEHQLAKGDLAAAVASARGLFERASTATDHADLLADAIDSLWQVLPAAARAELLSDYVSWVASQPLDAPRQLHRLVVLPLPAWPMHALKAAAEATEFGGPDSRFAETVTFDMVLAEFERRGADEFDLYQQRLNFRAEQRALAEPALLKGELLQRLLPERDPAAIAVYADVLSETQHPYGEFLTLSLQPTASAAKKAKNFATLNDETWLGALWVSLKVRYEYGLPISAVLEHGFTDVKRACAHPLVPFFRSVLRKKTKKQRRINLDLHDDYLALAAAMLPHSLVELDCADGVLEELATHDLSRLTHLHDVELTSMSAHALEVDRLPAVSWVGLRVEAGRSLQTFDLLQRDRSGFFAALKPHLDFFFVGGASSAELSQLKQAAAGFHGCSMSLDGVEWSS